MEDTDMSDRPKEKDRVRSVNGDHLGHSFEDDGISRRNNKKHKESHSIPVPETGHGSDSPIGDVEPVSAPTSPIRARTGISYKDSLIGVLPGAYEYAFFGNNMEDDGIISSDEEEDVEPPEEGEVVIKFTRELKHRIRAPWSTSLIVKVFGRSVGYVFLVNKLKTMWNFAGNFSCVDLGLGFFLIRFDSQSGFEDVLKRGPWFIGEHFLSLRPWVPNFRASAASVKTVAIWVRLPELPVEYYHKDSLLHIGSGLGPVLRVDFNTAAGTRGRFARICVQIDLDKPLARTVRIGKTRLAVIYEGIGLLCFHCGRIGHRSELCPSRTTEKEDIPAETASSRAEEEAKLRNFGPWMLVSRRKRQNKSAVTAVPRDAASAHAVPSRDRTDHTDFFSAVHGHVDPDRDRADHAVVFSAVQGHVADRAADLSAGQGHVNMNQHGLGVPEHTAAHFDVQKRDKNLLYSGFHANRRAVGSAEGQKRVKSNQQFRYSHLDKGKSKHVGGPSQPYTHGLGQSVLAPGEQVSKFKNSAPILSPTEPVFVFNIPNPNVISLQSQPPDQNTQTKNIPISSLSPQQPPASSSTISLRPQLPKSKGGNDKHSMGGVSVVQSISKLEDSPERSVHSDRRRSDRADSKGSTSCVGLVRRRDSSSMDRNSSSSPRRRSTSPNRHGLAVGDKPILELPNGHPENRWDSLSTKSSLSAIMGAEICPISGGGVLRNNAGIRREEGDALNSNPLQLGRKSEFSQISSDCEMRAPVHPLDPLLRVEGDGVPRVQAYLDGDSEQPMGDVAREGMELVGGGRNIVSTQ